MAENPKQGSKDITDLKARLGLKKQGGSPLPGPGGAAAPFPGPAGGPVGPAGPMASAPKMGGAMPVPAGMTVPQPHGAGAIPPPPGFTPPPEAAPAAADPRRDPYAAQQAALAANLASFYGRGEPLPGDATGVKQEPTGSKTSTLVGVAAGAGLLLGAIGYFVGSISVQRNDYNITTEHAAIIRDRVEKQKVQLNKIRTTLKDMKPFITDKELPNFAKITELGDLDFKEPDLSADLFNTNYASFEKPTVQLLFTYYNDLKVLSGQLEDLRKKTAGDKDSIEKFVASGKDRQNRGLGIVLDFSLSAQPLGVKQPLAQLVELRSLPECPNPTDKTCPPEEMKMRFRTTLGGGEAPGRSIKGNAQTLIYPLLPSELSTSILLGDVGQFAHKEYGRRVAAIFATLGRLDQTEPQLTKALTARAQAAKLFAL